MKLYIKMLCLAWLGTFALFAVSASAQDGTRITRNLMPHHARPSSGDASPVTKSSETSKAVRPDFTQTCTYPFTTGSGLTYMAYCVTVNGTLAYFQSPAGVEMLDQGGPYEGYGICDYNTGTAYWDYSYGDSGNWNAPVTVTNNATEVKITRTTSDGAWLLTLTISKVSGTTPAAKIVTALKNTSGVGKDVALMRYANFNPDRAVGNSNFNENYDSSLDGAWGYIPLFRTFDSPSDPYGLMLQSVGQPNPVSTEVEQFGFPQNSIDGPAPCDLGSTTFGNPVVLAPVTDSPGSGVFYYEFELNKNQTVTSTVRYFTF